MPALNIIIADDHHLVRSGLCKLVAQHSDLSVAAECRTGEGNELPLAGGQPQAARLDVRVNALRKPAESLESTDPCESGFHLLARRMPINARRANVNQPFQILRYILDRSSNPACINILNRRARRPSWLVP